MTGAARGSEAGFTLVEMLVGLAARADEHLGETAAAQFVLRHRLERTFPAKDTQAIDTVDFAGQDRSLDFLAPAPDRAGPDALHHYRLALARDGTLTLYHLTSLTTAVDLRDAATTGWQAMPLVRGAAGLAIAYFGPRAGAQGLAWQTNWLHRPTLPLLVRIRLDLTGSRQRGWPELVVHPRVANGDICERDLLTDQCRGGG